ncbi:MAG: hypothetical protein HN816_14410 [Gammaproteobacteria bacterium]|nr:hypothetical protein [Gammaproteobacteria bacterium]
MRSRHQAQLFDTDSLQADVMRFMAIIAFCLIAILALVQKMENDPLPSTKSKPEQEQEQEQEQVIPATVSQPAPDRIPPAIAKTLTLRFVSDGVFLKLNRQESIRLYGQSGDEFRQLKSNFTLESVPAKGNLYEVMPNSLPQAVRAVFTRHQDTDLFLVSLPDSIAGEVARLTSRHAGSGGEMLIDEKGLVRYEQDNQ